MASYATVSDVETRLGETFSGEDAEKITNMLEQAGEFIELKFSLAGKDISNANHVALKIVSVNIVSSWWLNIGIPPAATSISENVGGVSRSVSYNSSSQIASRNPLWISHSDMALLGLSKSIIRSISMELPHVCNGGNK